MTSSQFIYRAALAGGYSPANVGPVPDAWCWLCAGPTEGLGQLATDVISHTFTNANTARGGGNSICEACMFCLKTKALRTRSVLATPAGLRQPLRTEWREILVAPPEPPWLGTIALSGQKHLWIHAQVNYSNDEPWVMVEEMPVHYRPAEFAAGCELLEEFLATFTRTEIREASYQSHKIRRFGLERFSGLEPRVEALRRNRRLFDLVLLLARRPETEEPTTEKPTMEEPKVPSKEERQFEHLPLFAGPV